MTWQRALNLMPIWVVLLGSLGLITLLWAPAPGADLTLRLPIAENEPNLVEGPTEFVGTLETFDGRPGRTAGQWPGFRGPRRDAIVTETGLNLGPWSGDGPAVLWSVSLGEGYAGAAVRDGRVFVLDYDQERLGDAIRCFSLDDGREIWRYFYPVKVKRNHGMSRTVPAVGPDTVITLGPKCRLACLDPATGSLRWTRDLPSEDGAKVPPWYAGQCPLVDDGRLILGVGGPEALLMALDVNDGRVLWRTPNPHAWTMTHSSVAVMDVGDTRTYVYCASGGVVGVSAADGRLLWETSAWHINIANVPTPVVIDAARLFLCGGYNAGSLMLDIGRQGDTWTVSERFRLGPKVFGSDQQTPILYEGHLYGVRPNEELVCLDLAGTVLWTSTGAHKFGLGPYLLVDGRLLALNDEGHLSVVPATADGFSVTAEAQILAGHESWAPLALVGGRLLARDLTQMVCLELTP